MRLLISVSYYTPHMSGLTRLVKDIAELLAANGYSITVLTTQHEKQLPIQEKLNNVSILRIPFFVRLSKGFLMPSFLGNAYAALKKNDQVIVVLPQLEGCLVTLLAKMTGKKVHVFYVCEVTLEKGLFAKVIEQVLRLSHLVSLLLADNIITLTDDFAQHNPLLSTRINKVDAIYPIISPPLISEQAVKSLKRRISKRKYTIGFLGRIANEKGIIDLLAAIPLLEKKLGTDFLIVLAGPSAVGEETYAALVARDVKKYQEHVLWLPTLTDEEVGAFYSLLDVFVLPSINNTEAFGMVQVEAMLCGTPVVATDLPGVRVPVQVTGMGEIATSSDPADLAEKITTVLTQRAAYHKDKKVIEKLFSQKTILAHYKTLLRG